MKALIYLVRKEIKNFFRDLLHHPGRLIIYLLIIALFVTSVIGSMQEGEEHTGNYADIRILHGVVLAWLLFLGVATLLNALKSGTTMFQMSDVNFLFVSPIDPKTILTYGLVKQTAATLLGFIFILFYSPLLNEQFNISPNSVVALLVYSVFLLIVVQILALLFYSYCNGNDERKNKVRTVIYVYLGLMLMTALYVFQQNGATMDAGMQAIASPYLEYFPLIGWAQGAIFGVIEGNMTATICYTILLVASFVLVLVLFRRTNADYYEDVLQSTEAQFGARQAMKENRSSLAMARANKKVHVGKTGLNRGWGANTFFYKHLCEARRENKLVFLGTSSFVMLAANIIGVLVFSAMDETVQPDDLMLGFFAFDVYVLFLMNAVGYWAKELARPYIYLVPEDPFRKLLWASMMNILKPIVEGAVLFFITTLVADANPLSGIAAFLAYSSFGMIFVAGNILAKRTMGSMSNRGLVAGLFMLLLLLIMTPGVSGSVAVYMALEETAEASLLFFSSLPIIGWNIVASLIIIFLCRNLLSTVEVLN